MTARSTSEANLTVTKMEGRINTTVRSVRLASLQMSIGKDMAYWDSSISRKSSLERGTHEDDEDYGGSQILTGREAASKVDGHH